MAVQCLAKTSGVLASKHAQGSILNAQSDAAVEILKDSMNQISQLVQSAAQCCIKNFQSRYSFDISDSDSDSYSSTCSHKIPVTRHQLPLQYQYTVTEPCRFAAAAEIPRETASSTWQWLLGAL